MVRVAPVVVQELVYQIKALGSLEAEEMVHVTAEVEGAVVEVHFHEGDRVSQKTVLARIDPERYRVELERAKAALDQTKAELGRAQADLKRREELAAAELVAAEEMTRSRGENARLGAAVEVSQAALGIALTSLPTIRQDAGIRIPSVHASSSFMPTRSAGSSERSRRRG
jgi:multidrug efflux pump subunit AcrA (membrane-fusion protein)